MPQVSEKGRALDDIEAAIESAYSAACTYLLASSEEEDTVCTKNSAVAVDNC